MVVGRHARVPYHASMPLVARDVSFAYDADRPVLRGVSCAIAPGTLTAIVGPNGAGKSTLLRLLLGLRTPDTGEVAIDGVPVASLSHARRAARLIYMPQRASIAFSHTVRQYALMGLGAGRHAAPNVDAILTRLELIERADDPFATLSAGQQQRATVARALVQLARATSPAFILADEPASAMDPRHVALAADLLRDLAHQGHAVALVAHDLGLAARIATHALALDAQGRAAAQGPASEVLAPAVLDSLFGVRFVARSSLVPA